ncbi:hypothetical protein KDL45_16185, partial [bacterium]|nr:hypothetical protein [bacterium]
MNNRWMKIASRGALMAVMFFVFAAPSCQSSPVDGVWNVTGTDAQLGDYTGQVEFYHDGQTLKFARSVQYTNQAFKDYDVYTGWDGTAVSGESDTTATVALRTVDYIKQAEGLARDGSRTDDELVTGVFVSTGKNTMSATYTSAPVGDVSATETLTYVGPSGETPIFKMDDTYYASHNEMPSGIRNIIWNQLTEYHQLEYYDGYRDRPEFQAGIHFFPHFRTDFAWYRAHPDALRVPNKTVDGISLTETMLRARSFGPTLAEKAALFDADVQEYDISPVGMIA